MNSNHNPVKRLLSFPVSFRKGKGVGWTVGILFIVIVVLLIRHFLIGSYRISTHAMEEALHKGDFVLVDKWHAGNNVERKDILLFNSPLRKDKGNAPLLMSRCVALPGDTIHVSNTGYKINGISFPLSPYSLSTYIFPKEMAGPFLNLLQKLDIPQRNILERQNYIILNLTPFEEYQIREEINESLNKLFIREKKESYSLVVPQKGKPYRLTDSFLTASREAILAEAGERASFHNRKLLLDGKETNTFTFKRDYYWVLSDNTEDAVDSRHVGFIPDNHIIGKAWFCWYSKDKQHRFKKVD